MSRQIAIKHKYALWVVTAEKAAMQRVLSVCDDDPAFAENVTWPKPGEGDNVTTAEDTKRKSSNSQKPSSTGSNSQETGTSGAGSVYYENCTAVRDAGAAPVRRGDAGYATHLDRDGDGVGCE